MDNYRPPRATPHHSRSGSPNHVNNITQRFHNQVRVRPGSATVRRRVSDNASPLVRHHEYVRSRLKPLIYRPIPEPKQIIEKKLFGKR